MYGGIAVAVLGPHGGRSSIRESKAVRGALDGGHAAVATDPRGSRRAFPAGPAAAAFNGSRGGWGMFRFAACGSLLKAMSLLTSLA